MQSLNPTPITAQVCALIGEVLASPEVTETDNFFALNGQSVQAMLLLAQIQQRWGVTISLTELFDHPVLGEIAELVQGRAGESS